MLTLIRDKWLHLLAFGSVNFTYYTNAFAEDVDPSAPLKVLKDAKEKAKNSSLNATDISEGGTNAVNIAMVGAVVIGFFLALSSGINLYRGASDENSRTSPTRAVAGLVIGSLLTVIGLIVGVIVNYGFGGE